LAFKNGFASIVEELEKRLNEDRVITMNQTVDHEEKKDHGYHLLLSNGEVYKADAVIMATPHTALPKILSKYDIFKTFRESPMSSTANVALALDEKAIKMDISGTGFVVERTSECRISVCRWTHKKWPHTTQNGNILLCCYVGKPINQAVADSSDDEITEI